MFYKKVVNFSALFDRNNLTHYTNNATQYKHKHANCIVFELSVIALTPETFLMWKTACLLNSVICLPPKYINGSWCH